MIHLFRNRLDITRQIISSLTDNDILYYSDKFFVSSKDLIKFPIWMTYNELLLRSEGPTNQSIINWIKQNDFQYDIPFNWSIDEKCLFNLVWDRISL